MSMLLEALRKSEQRQRARAVPGINTDTPLYAAERPRRGSAWLWSGALLLAVAAVAGWYWWSSPAVPPAPAATVAAEAVTAPASTPGTRPAPPAGDGPATVAAPAAGDVPATVAAPAARPAASARPRPQPASPVARLAADTGATGAAAAPEPAAPAAQAAAPVVQAKAPEPAAPTEAPAPEPAAPIEAPAPISYWALPDAVRSQLPEMKISVLVFAGEPADRFVLMNGRRLEEGAQLQDGLSLEEIRRDGAVMRFKMYRFLVRHD